MSTDQLIKALETAKRVMGTGLPGSAYANAHAEIDAAIAAYRAHPSEQAGEREAPDRDEAIRVWRKNCDPFVIGGGSLPPTPVIDAMLEFARATLPKPADAVAVEPEEGYCPRCGGSGEFDVPSNGGPDPEMIPTNCNHCGGTGSLLDAYQGVAKLLEQEHAKYLQLCARDYFAAPPARRVGLTEERIRQIWRETPDSGDDWTDVLRIARAIEAHHGIRPAGGEGSGDAN
jgi:hypothetical protein